MYGNADAQGFRTKISSGAHKRDKADKQKKDTHFVIRTSDEFKELYKKFCDDNGYTMSKRIISLMKNDLNGKDK